MQIIDPHAKIKQKGLQKLKSTVKGAVITVSDRCALNKTEDKSGPLAKALLQEYQISVKDVVIVPDGIDSVQEAIKKALSNGARVIFTTGGTGVTPRDLTPEATAPLLELQLPAIAQQIVQHGLTNTPLASLSRALVGISSRGEKGALIVNLPGSKGGVKDGIAVVGPLIPHILEQFDPASFPLGE